MEGLMRAHVEQENLYRMCFVGGGGGGFKAYACWNVSIYDNKNEKYSKSIFFPPFYVLVTQAASFH
jgi:hypothetical protein